MFYQGFFFLLFLSSFFRRLISEVAEPNSTKIGHMFGSNCDLKKHVQNLEYPVHLQNNVFWTTSQLRNETRYKQSVKRIDIYKGSATSSKMSWTSVHKRLQTRPPFLSTLCKFCFLRHCQASLTEISKQNSTKLCQTAEGESLTICCRTEKIGGQKLLHLFGFSTTSTLNGEYLLNETWHRQSGKGVGSTKGWNFATT